MAQTSKKSKLGKTNKPRAKELNEALRNKRSAVHPDRNDQNSRPLKHKLSEFPES